MSAYIITEYIKKSTNVMETHSKNVKGMHLESLKILEKVAQSNLRRDEDQG